MTNQDLMDRTMVGKVARRFDFKFNAYYTFLTLLNLAALALAIYDAKGLLILLITIGFSLNMRLKLTQREEQRITNELLEEILENSVPLRPVK
ncbi:hypothetical protein [Deinococcus humi]|uniref:Uncharacterized protein n=1 Tax=Deinococcus humi TaxID=662880 RepID=A0A7W8NHT3_9DEIO|nr:hypothetical protein [Deinococcus humi]MBB5364337.1 hypothetical protein [Deinococcus humi]GGO33500.1 hypothetical protein GCM10008949_32770 [Deinococcus humi]